MNPIAIMIIPAVSGSGPVHCRERLVANTPAEGLISVYGAHVA